MKINEIPRGKLIYGGFLAAALSYFAYCQFNGLGLLYFMNQTQNFTPQGNQARHK
jgi:hypothetical protein